jgi:hypothetical protein
MLIGSEPDLAERSDVMLFPVFGRGRALLPLIGAGITEKNIYDAAAFLVGPCSCEIKEQNPGFDLLLSADWDGLLAASGLAVAAAVPTISEPAVAELVPIPKGSANVSTAAAAETPVKQGVAEQASTQPAITERPIGMKTKASLALLLGGVGLAGILAMVSLVAATEVKAPR